MQRYTMSTKNVCADSYFLLKRLFIRFYISFSHCTYMKILLNDAKFNMDLIS